MRFVKISQKELEEQNTKLAEIQEQNKMLKEEVDEESAYPGSRVPVFAFMCGQLA